MTKDNPIYLALDIAELEYAYDTVKKLSPYIGGVKIGLEFFCKFGIDGILSVMSNTDVPLFLDLKFNDIPNTVAGAIKSILTLNPKLITMHISSGENSLIAAKEAIEKYGNNIDKPKLIGVSVLTSQADNDLIKLGINSSVDEQVLKLSNLAVDVGIDGIVCSPHEIKIIKEKHKNKLKLIVPGIRTEGLDLFDQKRTLSAKEAIDAGADILVIGRPIIASDDQIASAKNILKQIGIN